MLKYSKLKEVRVKKNSVYRGVVGFNVDTVKLLNNKSVKREYMVHNGASAILPVINDKKIILVQQYRYPVGEATWEIPAGKLDNKKDSPLKTAKRELKEETGYTAKNWKKLIKFYPCCAFSDEVVHIYMANDLKKGKANPDSDEFLNVKIFSLKEAYEMLDTGKIKDAKTIISLEMYRNIKETIYRNKISG